MWVIVYEDGSSVSKSSEYDIAEEMCQDDNKIVCIVKVGDK